MPPDANFTAAQPAQDTAWMQAPRPAHIRVDDRASPCAATIAEGMALAQRVAKATALMRGFYEAGNYAAFATWACEANRLIDEAMTKHAAAIKGAGRRRLRPV